MAGLLFLGAGVLLAPAEPQEPAPGRAFLERHCFDCHGPDHPKGGLDLESLRLENLSDSRTFAAWVKIHDRVESGEMPPAKRPPPPRGELEAFLRDVARPLAAFDRAREKSEGRSTWRRLNRYEYENSVRDLLGAPWLGIKEMLPEDGESHRFNKIGDALDISYVQMAQYLAAADYALREVLASGAARPESRIVRSYARDNPSFTNKMLFNEFNQRAERATFPTLGFDAQPEVRSGKAPVTVGPAHAAQREQEGVGVVASAYEPLEPRFAKWKAPQDGRYKVRLCAHSVWVGPGKGQKWWIPDLDSVSRGRRSEPLTLYSETPPRQLRRLGAFDVGPDPTVGELEVNLLKGESIRPDPSRLFRSRPSNWHNPLAQKDGCPGVVYRWLEVEGPLVDAWPPPGYTLLMGAPGAAADPEALLRGFLKRAYRRPATEAEVARFLGVIRKAQDAKLPLAEALIDGYSAVLCSPGFVCLEEKPGPLDPPALAERLSYFLWNSPPDEELRRADLAAPPVLAAQVERLLGDPRSRRFVDAFLDYWLDLRRVNATSPDAELYNDYYLDDLLTESADLEPRLFFSELLRRDLAARNIVSSDFVMVNERLAVHYGLAGVDGVGLRSVPVPEGSPRGGLITQACVLKVTANGTTTSPVLRGAWIMERILGKPVPPPPPSVPAIEPDIRGAHTIREQLDKHRSLPACALCHSKIDPAGFALENFDVFGGWRTRYRALGKGTPPPGYGKNGLPFEFHDGLPVDASGTLPGGGEFKDVRELKALLLKDERQIARNLARQLVVYATGAPIRFGDRAGVEEILDRSRASGYGVRTIIREIVMSDLFRCK